MGNIVTYLRWRGDLDFREREFCDADNLVLSALAGFLWSAGKLADCAMETGENPARKKEG